jgi:hypothetical protein
MVWLIYALLFVALPYGTYLSVRYWTGSVVTAWVAAVLAIPVGVFLYAHLFERLKHRSSRNGRLPDDRDG